MVKAAIDGGKYPTGVRITASEMNTLPLAATCGSRLLPQFARRLKSPISIVVSFLQEARLAGASCSA